MQQKSKPNERISYTKSLVLALLLSVNNVVKTNDVGITPELYGVDHFGRGDFASISAASLAGGTEIMFNGVGMSMTPENFQVLFTKDSNFEKAGQALSKDNSFNSNTHNGKLQYTTPSLMTLFNRTYDQLDGYEWITFQTSLIDSNSNTGVVNQLKCQTGQNCYITMSRSYTPVHYYMQPRVVHHGSETSFYVDPKSAQSFRQAHDLPFVEGRINGKTLNFEKFVTEDTVLSGWALNSVRANVYELSPNASAEVNLKWRVGNSLQKDSQMIQCDIQNTNCYKVKVVPVISKISSKAGYTSGGQILQVDGYGFESNNINVKVDGVDCTVLTHSTKTLTCKTQAQSTPSTDAFSVGSNGLRRKFFNITNSTQGWSRLNETYLQETTVALSFESPMNQKDGYSGSIYNGYFKPPVTGRYRFYMACDDGCILKMNVNGSNTKDPAGAIVLLNSGYTQYRNYLNPDQKEKQTEWLTLNQDTHYYIEGSHIQYTGGDYFTVSVEIDVQNSNHRNAMKEIQRLQINPENMREQHILKVTNPDEGTFDINLLIPGTTTYYTATINSKGNAEHVRSSLNDYWSKNFGCNIQVTLDMQDDAGPVQDMGKSKLNTYTISVLKQQASDSIIQAPILKKVTTTATLQFTKVSQKSSQVLSGNFIIRCELPDGSLNATRDIPTSYYPYQIVNSIVEACPNYKDKITVWDGLAYSYYVDGRDIMIRFTDINKNIQQFIIESSATNATVGNNVAFASTTTKQHGESIFYEPVPFEFLFTNEVKPQVKVTVDNLPAVCSSLDCGYVYEVPVGQITQYSLDGTTLTIQGTDLPLQNDIESIKFSNVLCTISTITTTQIVCNLQSVVAGTWAPELTDKKGLIPIANGSRRDRRFLTPDQIIVTVTASSISPSTGVNPNGGTKLTIYGSNFPISLNEPNILDISFGGNLKCAALSSKSGEIKCTLPKFPAAGTYTVTLTVNTQVDSTQQIVVSTSPASLTLLTPNQVSPVLKQQIVISVDSTFSRTLDINDLTVTLVDTAANSKYSKQINVVAVDDTLKTITVKYGGIYSGNYSVNVFSESYGMLGNSGIILQAIGGVTSFTPTSGSIYGGTLITIIGGVFSSDDFTDNPVKIGTTDCLVVKTSIGEIKCRTLPRLSSETEEPLIVFLKTSEEAVCNNGAACIFQWIDAPTLPVLDPFDTPTITYSSDVQDYQLTLTGSGFPTQISEVTFKIDGVEQTIFSTSATQIVITITSMLSSSSKNIEFYLPSGTPKGADQLTTKGIQLSPMILSTTPSSGSLGGSLLTAVIKGVGIKSSSVTLFAGQDICQSVVIEAYGIVKCQTKADLTIAPSSILQSKVGTQKQQCSDSTLCTYETSTSMPAVASLAIQSDNTQLVFTGSNFIQGYTATVTYQGVNANTVTIDSDTQVTATFSLGVPLAATAVNPKLTFVSTPTASIQHTASGTVTISNPLGTPSSSSIDCSFAGGCLFSIVAPGLATTLSQPGNQVKVCDKPCELDALQSTSATMKCRVPKLSTSHSVDKFKIEQESYIMGTVFATNWEGRTTLTDDQNQTPYLDTSATCSFGVSFSDSADSGHIGQLSEVKYFMPVFDKTLFSGKLKFQGSYDNSSFTDIFKVENEIHEGWNYYSFREDNLKYRHYRFQGRVVGACKIGEMKFRGVKTIANNDPEYICPVTLTLSGQNSITLAGQVTYQTTRTANLEQITPRYGKVQGGETVTFTGTGFSTVLADYNIKIDDVVCTVTAATTTSVSCLTGKRPGLHPTPTLVFEIAGRGNVATQGRIFRYVNYWSLIDTWGGEFLPIEGESVSIPPGLHLLVDVDTTPVLNALIVEGSLIFPPNANPDHVRTFDAHYIMISGGYMEVGTEEFPYTSKLIITMHSNKESPELPIYGNKCIAVRNGILDFHGVPRNPTWAELDQTVEAGSNKITMIRSVDWQVYEKIVIAPTGYDNRAAEVRTITNVNRANPDKPIITLDSPLEFKHYSGIDKYSDDDFIEMRAEVGLLTRNVVYRGDKNSEKNQFGAHIMLHSAGDESLIGRIEYIELTDVGQAFQLGRYPLHFHLIGTVHNSYIRGNSIHHTYNRAVTIHAVHYLRVLYNVAYHTMGHTFFIEDAVETKNLIQGNLAVQTMASMSLLNTDQTPASFWITHPDNIFKDNHAAGSDRYGYWFDTKPHPMGPSFTEDICPENAQLGEFSDNVAHSNGKYGLRIFHKLIPRANPCGALIYNATNVADPYHQNPLVTANFYNLRSWKNNRNGAIAEQVGDVRFINFKVADNLVGGIEFSLTADVVEGYAQIINALVIGHSANAEDITMTSSFHGIITPRTENFQVNGARFYHFDQPGHACFGSCSHCFHPASTDSGARHVSFSQIYFDPTTVLTKIRYQSPFRDIFYDTDGTLTGYKNIPGLKDGGWATPYWPHNVQPECEVFNQTYDGIICKSSVQIRRIVHYNYAPTIFENNEFKVMKFDDNLYTNKTEFIWSMNNVSDYSIAPFKSKLDPLKSWAMPYVTGHKYKLHWRYGIDFTQMQVDQSIRWKDTDKDVYFVYNFTDVRAKVDIITLSDNKIIANETLTNNSKLGIPWQSGDNIVYNDTATREIHVVYNGRNSSRSKIMMKGYRCNGPCLTAITEVAVETNVRKWSDPKSWTSGKVPLAGEDAVVEAGWNMIYDIDNANAPIYRMIQINGRLTFDNENDDGKNLYLNAKYIFVRAGGLVIGNETRPFRGTATITLYGEKANEQIVYDEAIEAGNKILANTGNISIYGAPRKRMTRLLETAQLGTKTLKVEAGLDWNANERIALAPTTLRWKDSDSAIIVSYDNTTGALAIKEALKSYHYGAPVSTGSDYNGVDMRGEVYLLSRNVKIQGNDSEAWGCQIVTSDFVEITSVVRRGSTFMDNVEINNCSQYDTNKASLRFQGNKLSWSEIRNSAIHDGWGIGAYFENSANVKLTNNVFFAFVKRGVSISTQNKNITLDGNHVIDVKERTFLQLDMVFEPTGAILSCANDNDVCSDISIVNNVAAGAPFTGFAVYAHTCEDKNQKVFRDNIAHSNRDTGAIIFANISESDQKTCMEASKYTAYKNGLDGIVSFHKDGAKKVVFSNMTLIDNGFGATPMVGQEGDDLEAQVIDSLFYGETEARDCSYENECLEKNHPGCKDKSALQLAYYAKSGKNPLPISASKIPVHNIKSDASFGGKTTYNNLQFFNYKSQNTFCGQQQVLFKLNRFAADYIPKATFIKPKFTNINKEAMAFLYTPPVAWANLDDCGNFPCTAPNNVLLDFQGAKFYPWTSEFDENFQIVANNKDTIKEYYKCTIQEKWNGYLCINDDLGVLLFESIDDDKMKRMITPIKIISNVTGSTNTLNTFMDHIWDGFYTGQLRLARWPSIIETRQREGIVQTYDIKYSGTPPGNQRFKLIAESTSGVILRIDYTKPGAYVVTDFSGKIFDANKWNDKLKQLDPIKGQKCGENRYLGVSNILEFYIDKRCDIMIKPVDSIKTNIRMDWTMDAFYSAGGTTKFIDRVALSLGIHASTIKVVAVYKGSVIVEFEIDPKAAQLTATSAQNLIQNTLKSDPTAFGAPVLSASAGGTTIVSNGVIVNAGTNSNTGTTNTGGTPTITNPVTDTTNKNPTITVQSGGSNGNDDQVKLIVILVVIVVVIIVGAIASYFIYQKHQSNKNMKEISKMNPTNGGMKLDKLSQDATVIGEQEVYEAQYHPKILNIFNGQIQKINEADNVNDTQNNEEEENNTDHSQVLQRDVAYDQASLSQSRPSIDSEYNLNQKKRKTSIRLQNDNENGSKKVYQNILQ